MAAEARRALAVLDGTSLAVHSLFDESVGRSARRYRAGLVAAEAGQSDAPVDQRTALRAARAAFDRMKN